MPTEWHYAAGNYKPVPSRWKKLGGGLRRTVFLLMRSFGANDLRTGRGRKMSRNLLESLRRCPRRFQSLHRCSRLKLCQFQQAISRRGNGPYGAPRSTAILQSIVFVTSNLADGGNDAIYWLQQGRPAAIVAYFGGQLIATPLVFVLVAFIRNRFVGDIPVK
jgi:hypothetical protein